MIRVQILHGNFTECQTVANAVSMLLLNEMKTHRNTCWGYVVRVPFRKLQDRDIRKVELSGYRQNGFE